MTIDTPFIRKLYMAPPVSVLTGLYCIWLLSHSSLGRRIGGGGGGEGEKIVWPNSAFLVGKTVPYVLGAIPTSFSGFCPPRPFKSYQYCRNCQAEIVESWETHVVIKYYVWTSAKTPTSLVTTLCNILPTSLTFVYNGQRTFSSDSSVFCLLENQLSIEITSLR